MLARLLALLLICTSTSFAQETPLSEIWGLNMPGTKDVYGLGFAEFDRRRDAGWGPTEFREMREDAIDQMILALSDKLPPDEAPRGFIVPWEPNSHMLKRTSDALRMAKKYELLDFDIKEYPKGSDLTLVYFSYPSSYYNDIREVKREDHLLTVSYQVVPHYTADSTVHFALIPLRDLPAGEYQVKFKQLRMDKQFLEAGFIPLSSTQQKRYVCNNFVFRIWEPVVPDRTEASEGAVDIPLSSIWGFNMSGTRDMRELNPPHKDERKSSLNRIHSIVYSSFRVGEKAGPGFAVSGTGVEALSKLEQILGKKAQIDSVFAPTEDIYLYIFNRRGTSVRLDRVVRDGKQIRVEYHFGSQNDVGSSLSFVLVPLGRLEQGRYSVVSVGKLPIS